MNRVFTHIVICRVLILRKIEDSFSQNEEYDEFFKGMSIEGSANNLILILWLAKFQKTVEV